MESLEELIHVVGAEKYNCHASSILDDTDDVTQQIGDVSVKDRKVGRRRRIRLQWLLRS
jgi:hypothetical protein